jgi:hypothetical protein
LAPKSHGYPIRQSFNSSRIAEKFKSTVPLKLKAIFRQTPAKSKMSYKFPRYKGTGKHFHSKGRDRMIMRKDWMKAIPNFSRANIKSCISVSVIYHVVTSSELQCT